MDVFPVPDCPRNTTLCERTVLDWLSLREEEEALGAVAIVVPSVFAEAACRRAPKAELPPAEDPPRLSTSVHRARRAPNSQLAQRKRPRQRL
mmetsp:Transcript_117357/g.216031  ORF Transcript_117357/g.216031 Transcript_117357/m.216031 type:complete len:92 (+) Transcript_117357:627-902(+)